MKIQLKRSNVLDGGKAKEPTASQMEYGELAVNYNESDPSLFIKDSNNNIVKIADLFSSGDGALTIQTSGGDAATGTFTANQSGPSTLTLPQISYTDLKDIPPDAAAPGNGALTIQTSGGDSATGTFTANQAGGSTLTLPAIAYADLTGKPTIPAAANNGALTIQTSGGDTATGTFTANQANASTLTLPAIDYADLTGKPTIPAAANNGALTIQTSGGDTATGTFTANQSGPSTLTLPQISYSDLKDVPPVGAAPGNGALTIETSSGDAATGTFTANQNGASTLTLPAIAYADLTGKPSIPAAANNGALTIQTSGGDSATGTFTANQSGDSTLTLPQISYTDLKDVPPTGAAPGNGALTIETSSGDAATGTFTANQNGASTLTLPAIDYADLTGRPTIPAAANNGTITIKQPGTVDQTFAVNQANNTTINLKNDNTVVTPGDGALTIETSGGDAATGTFTANQAGASTLTLPAIAYADLTGKPSIPAPAGNGTITIVQPGTTNQTFTVNQSGNTTISLKNDNTVVTPGNGALTIRTSGGDTATGTFTANQSTGSTLTLPAIAYSDLTGKPSIPAAANNGRITIKQPGTTDQSFTVDQSGNTTITLKNDNTVVTPGDGALTIKTAGENKSASGSFTANQSGASTITLPTIRYADLSGTPTIPAAAGNGTITIVQPGTSNQTFTVNQSGNKTITLKNDNTQASTDLGNSTTTSAVTVTSSTGSNTTIAGASTSKAGVMTSSQVNTLNGALQRSGGTMTGDINMGNNNINNVEYIAGPTTATALPIYSRSGSAQSSLVGDGFGWTVNQQSSNVCAGIRYKNGNSWIGLTYVSNSVMAPFYNNTAWGNVAVTSSDVRLKKDISTITDGALNTVNALNPVKFRWKDEGYYTISQRTLDPEGTFKYGFIANEIETVLPEAMVVREPDEDDPEPIKDYEDRAIIAMLCKAVQELSAKVETLEAQLNP